MNTTEIKHIFKELITVYQNLKTEVILTEVQEHTGLKSEQVIINHKSTFKRPYRRDLLTIESSKIEDELLSIDVSRNGIYDYLPEGLFHTQKNTSRTSSFSANRVKSKQEEAAARSLFSPIENEFFHQRLEIEKNERLLLNNFYSLKDDYLIEFWKLSQDMPRAYLLKLIKLLPYNFKIAGNLELTRLSLEKILKNNVTFKKKYDAESEHKKNRQKDISRLGVDAVLDNKEQTIFHPYLEVTIWLKNNEEISSYLSNQGINKFLSVFYSYFIPLELDVKTKYEVQSSYGFSLNPKDNSTIGISTKI
ncbi:hypothetical protein [Lacinutrix chionoecetis]